MSFLPVYITGWPAVHTISWPGAEGFWVTFPLRGMGERMISAILPARLLLGNTVNRLWEDHQCEDKMALAAWSILTLRKKVRAPVGVQTMALLL